jgi:MoCo/4Fe-4S cofactor protein with predicted Tat translocation signal
MMNAENADSAVNAENGNTGLPDEARTNNRALTPDVPAKSGRRYWRGLEELAETPEFKSWLEREFPEGAAELEVDGVSRRNFMRLMGASLALAGVGLSGCRRPETYIVPYTKSVEWLIPGKAILYTTSMPRRLGGMPLIATTFEGRPTKLEGNPLVPGYNGGTDLLAQASILNLYDPDRARFFRENGTENPAEKFEAYLKQVRNELQQNGGAGFALLLDEQWSPTRDRVLKKLQQDFPQARFYYDEPLGNDEVNPVVEALFGADVVLRPNFANADVILSLDADFLGLEQTLDNIKVFSARRRVRGSTQAVNRLYSVDNRFTITGGMADHRLRCPASHVPSFAVALANKIAQATGDQGLTSLAGQFKTTVTFDEKWVTECANDLVARKGKSLVLLGNRYPAAIQALTYAINNALEAFGATIQVLTAQKIKGGTIQDLAKDVKAGTVKRLFILAGNPAYTAPADLQWAEQIQKQIPEVVQLGYWENETSANVRWFVPEAHFLEAWGDQRDPNGTYLPVQPMIQPLFGGWSQLDLLGKLAGIPGGLEAVRETFKTFAGSGDFEEAWTGLLRHGFIADTAYQASSVKPNFGGLSGLVQAATTLPGPVSASALEIVFPGDYRVEDGRYTNNAWLQEMPDPITKLTWDNAVQVSPVTAKALGLEERDLIEITVGDRKLTAAVLVAPGHADNSFTFPLGYGRDRVGQIGEGCGFNAYKLRTTAALYFATGVTIKLVQKDAYKLIRTQLHHSMEGRALVREGALEDYEKNPAFAKKMWMDAEIPPNISLYSHPPLNAPNQWAMVVDLNTCIGCSACVIACQAENNIPVVGKDQVERGREMQWMRIDRYFSSADGDVSNPHLDEDPEMVVEPMMCQHCENAPCETVCPVNATVHSEEGLNVMVYNRCIGTRYCSNNCPFKVRRFNFFNYNDRSITDKLEWGLPGFQGKQTLILGPLAKWGMDEISKLQKNPNVTVRSRGVMEKCTYCVQRIETAKISQRIKAGVTGDLSLPTDSVRSACQEACPAEAIVFGDMKDPESQVSKERKLPQEYHLLEYLNIQTRTGYLARLRNPNPKMPGAAKIGKINAEHDDEQRERTQNSVPTGGNA